MIPSLKGVFPRPKVEHKRDFLRENRLYLKDLERACNHHLMIKAEKEQKLAELRNRQRHKTFTRCPTSRKATSTECSCDSAKVESKKVETCHREVQTDDIWDEEFLYQALKKCSPLDTPTEVYANNFTVGDHQHDSTPDDDYCNIIKDNLNFENLSIDAERVQLTASNTTLSSKRSHRKVHELGDRQNVRLPKYLEREKREKELRIQEELERDHDIPIGYKSLSQVEIRSALDLAQTKFQNLVDELNRMPMTTETLRIRCRKTEIERELVDLENDIRVFSKPKVYVKVGEAH